jgi:hypothetical protein
VIGGTALAKLVVLRIVGFTLRECDLLLESFVRAPFPRLGSVNQEIALAAAVRKAAINK